MNAIDSLAGGDITKWDAVLDMSADDCYVKLCMMSETRRYMRDFNQILTSKHKEQ